MHTPISPKAIAAAAGTLLASVIIAVLTAPGLNGYLDGLPPIVQFLILSAIPPLVGFLSAYAKRDPLRDVGAQAISAATTFQPVTPSPAYYQPGTDTDTTGGNL